MKFLRILAFSFVLALFPALTFANEAPVANPGGPYQGVTREAVFFSGAGSSDADGDFLTYSWDFGDGQAGFGAAPVYAYADPGEYIVTLVVNDGTVDSEPATTEVTIGLAPPENPINPEDEAGSAAFPLVFEWEEVEGAESYFYQVFGMEGEPAFNVADEISGPLPEEVLKFLSPKPYEEYKKQCEEAEGGRCSDEEIQRVIIQRQTKYWRVKSCTLLNPSGPDDPSCGPWSDPLWSFVYIPQPPENLEQPNPDSSDVSLPVILRWSETENAKSYLVDVRVDTGCAVWERFVGFFFGGFGAKEECDPVNLLTEPLFDALHDWFGIGEGYDASCPWPLWDSETEECSTLVAISAPGQETAEPQYVDDECVFSKNAPYLVTVASCLDERARICGEWSERWSFSTGDTRQDGTPYILSTPELAAPKYDPAEPLPVVGKKHQLGWTGGSCGGYVRLLIETGGIPVFKDSQIIPNFDAVLLGENALEELWDEPNDLSREYAWSLQPCWRIKDDIRCESGIISEEWRFKTIGEPPLLKNPGNGEFAKVLGDLAWQHIDGAGSYLIQTAENESFTEKLTQRKSTHPPFILSLDDFEPGKQYWWRVKTCADEGGDVCGTRWSEIRTFHTHPLLAPTNPEPIDGTEFSLPGTLRWDPDDGASYYQYQVRYTSLKYGKDEGGSDITENRPACINKVGDTVVPRPGGISPITSQPSFYLSEHCRGEYEWLVRSCADKGCEVAAPSIPLWRFTAIKETSEESSGLVPCGKSKDSTSTPFDETEPCQTKHIGFLMQNILDFVLWKLSLIILAVLAVFVGASTYFSFGSPDVITRVRAIFRSYFYGVLVLLFAWAIVNIIMGVFGFNVEFFGRWYELPF